MNLTVAIKIKGGFAIIALLLIASSLFSLSHLKTIQSSTKEMSDLAIPTLAGSNQLTLELTQMGNLTLRGYYQSELAPLADNQQSFENANNKFSSALKKLKALVQEKNNLITNLRKVDDVYNSFSSNVDNVFQNRRISIEQVSALTEKIDILEEKADDAATL